MAHILHGRMFSEYTDEADHQAEIQRLWKNRRKRLDTDKSEFTCEARAEEKLVLTLPSRSRKWRRQSQFRSDT